MPQKTIVLAIEMLASEHKQTVDWQLHGIPVERFYYDFVKEALYSQDEAVLKEWLAELCDCHLNGLRVQRLQKMNMLLTVMK